MRPDNDSPTPRSDATATGTRVPRIDDSAKYRAALANLERLQHDLARLEAARDDAQKRRALILAEQQDVSRAVLAGRSPGDVRREMVLVEADHRKLGEDIRVVRGAIELAKKELAAAENLARSEVAARFAPAYRARLRAAAVAFLEYARIADDFRKLNQDIQAGGLYGYSGLDSPLPLFQPGPIESPDSHCARIVRDLIEQGVIDAKADADLLRGFAVAPKFVPYEPPAPKPAAPKKPLRETYYGKLLRGAGLIK